MDDFCPQLLSQWHWDLLNRCDGCELRNCHPGGWEEGGFGSHMFHHFKITCSLLGG